MFEIGAQVVGPAQFNNENLSESYLQRLHTTAACPQVEVVEAAQQRPKLMHHWKRMPQDQPRATLQRRAYEEQVYVDLLAKML